MDRVTPRPASSVPEPARARPHARGTVPAYGQDELLADSFDTHKDHAPKVLQLAREEAQGLSHKHVGTEHLLLGLMREQQGAAARVLSELGVTHARVQNAVRFIIGQGEHAVADDITLTPRAKNVIELAIAEARALGHDSIGTEHLLLALLRDSEGVAVGVLESLGVNLGRVWANTFRILGIPPGLRPELPSTHRWRDQNVRVLRERLKRRRVWSIQGYSQIVGPLLGLPSFTTGAIRALEEAELTAWWLHHQQVEPAHLLVGLIREHKGIAAQALRHVAVTEHLVVAELERLLPKGQPLGTGAALDMSPAFQQVLEDAHHMLAASVGTEHLLLALIAAGDEDPVHAVIARLGTTASAIRSTVDEMAEPR
jgi:ATP-dependent Clp protease ATP-binding subunit ClpA